MSKASKAGQMSLASAAIATAAACGHAAPGAAASRADETAECRPMSREELEEVARAPRIGDRPDALRKMDSALSKAIRRAELAAEGRPSKIRVPGFPDGCIPAMIEILIVHTGDSDVAEQAFSALGVHIASHTRGAPYSFVVGSVSPARLADLASLPYVRSISGPNPMPYSRELDDSIETIRVDQIRIADPAATGAGVVIAIIDSGIDWKHGSFRLPDGRTRILGIWDHTLRATGEEKAGLSPTPNVTRGVIYTRDDIDHSLGHPVDGPAVMVRTATSHPTRASRP